jgi:hypothetical protein
VIYVYFHESIFQDKFIHFYIYKLNNLKVINDLYSQYLTQTLSKTTSKSDTKEVRVCTYAVVGSIPWDFCTVPHPHTPVVLIGVLRMAGVRSFGPPTYSREQEGADRLCCDVASPESPCSFGLISTISSHLAVFFSHNKPANSTFSTINQRNEQAGTVTVDHVTHFMHDTSPRNFHRVRPYAGCRVTQLLCPLCVLTAHMPSPGIYRHFTCAVPVPPRSSLLLCLHSAGVALSVALPPLYGYEVHVPTTYGRHRQRVVVDDAPAPPDARVARAWAWLSLSGERFPGVAHG